MITERTGESPAHQQHTDLIPRQDATTTTAPPTRLNTELELNVQG
jgi:hypothetical protein